MRANCKGHVTSLASLVSSVAFLAAMNVAEGAGRSPVGPTAASLGVVLVSGPQGLIVSGLTAPSAYANLRVGDRITAVNGQRVATEAAFLNRLAVTGSGATIMVIRNGSVQTLTILSPRPSGLPRRGPAVASSAGGLINPSQMVITSQGVMHKDVAARLGLPGVPFTGSPESSGGVPTTSFLGGTRRP
jgi:predicted metalloprotease with PDZ domain